MSQKRNGRQRRARKTRARIRRQGAVRLNVFRSPRHIYAQVIDPTGSRVLAAASTIDKDVRDTVSNGGNIEAAKIIGTKIAEKAKAAGVEKVAFDRSGYHYHGRIKALADAAREGGLSL